MLRPGRLKPAVPGTAQRVVVLARLMSAYCFRSGYQEADLALLPDAGEEG